LIVIVCLDCADLGTLDKVRFTYPVRAVSRVRGRFLLGKLEDISGGMTTARPPEGVPVTARRKVAIVTGAASGHIHASSCREFVANFMVEGKKVNLHALHA